MSEESVLKVGFSLLSVLHYLVSMSRIYDIALLGATGFTGELVAHYLMTHAHREGLSIALAGRNEQKGAELIKRLKNELVMDKEIAWITADIRQTDTLLDLARQTRILMNTAGPFAHYGPPVVKACVEAGTHYIDITGEPSFYHNMIEQHHDEAVQKGVSIIPACAFDSVPADSGTFDTVKQMEDKERLTVKAYLRTNARFSGGTWTTAIHALIRRQEQSQEKRGTSPPTRKIPLKIHYVKELDRWALPMPVLDPHVVKRTANALTDAYGPSFAYGQFFTVGSFWKLVKMIASFSVLFLVVRFKWGQRWLLDRHQPGTGPSAHQRARSRFEFTFIGSSENNKVRKVISGGDPGYDETSAMFSNCAFSLIDRIRRDEVVPGVVTPVWGLGEDLLSRLKKQLTFE